MQKLEPPVVLIRVDNQLVVYGDHLRRAVLTHPVKLNLNTAEFELEHGRDALDALDHAGGDCGQEQLRRIERIWASVHICVQSDRGIRGRRLAAVAIDSSSGYAILQHRTHPCSGRSRSADA